MPHTLAGEWETTESEVSDVSFSPDEIEGILSRGREANKGSRGWRWMDGQRPRHRGILSQNIVCAVN